MRIRTTPKSAATATSRHTAKTRTRKTRTAVTAATATATAALLVATSAPAFASVGTTPRSCAQPDGRVNAIAISAGRAYIAGTFTSVKSVSGKSSARAGLAAIDTATCDLLPWTASTDGPVLALRVVGSTVYAGGSFTKVNGQARSGLAGLSTTTGEVTAFSATFNHSVMALTSSSTTLYAGGDFTKVDGKARGKLASFTLSTGAMTAWAPKATGKVTGVAMSADGTKVYAGGNFTALGGDSAAAYLGAVDAATGTVDKTFHPQPGFPLDGVAADSRGVYGAGAGSGGHLGIWNLDGSLQRPIYQTDGDVQAVAVDGGSVYAGGHYNNYCVGNTGFGRPFVCNTPLSRRKLLEVSLSSGSVTSWAPALNSPYGVFALTVDPATHQLWVGGDFTKVGSTKAAHLAVLQ